MHKKSQHQNLRLDDQSLYVPRYLQFEDPEYNRLICSVPGKASRNIKISGTERATLTLAVDRTEYNPGDRVHLVYSRDNSSTASPAIGNLEIIRLDEIGSRTLLEHEELVLGASPRIKSKYVVKIDELLVIELSELGRPQNISIHQNDNIIFRLKFDDNDPGTWIDLIVPIVSRPVTPVPQAAYAVLRQRKQGENWGSMDCARFAWSPEPSRIELICPDDLLGDVVRRRAVFQLQETVRNHHASARTYHFAIQKISALGSTHFPETLDLVE